MSELRGCPFCEGEGEVGRNIAGGYFIRCSECGARGPIETSEDRATKKWNDWPEPVLSEKIPISDQYARARAALLEHWAEDVVELVISCYGSEP